MSHPAKLRAIIFDFDGVICESNDIKTHAFRKLFSDYPEYMDQIITFHQINGGLSRFEKFTFIYRELLKENLSEEKSIALGNQFSKYVYEDVLKAPLVKGADIFLKKYHQDILCFIASGTPHEEIRSIISKKSLGCFFKGVYGAPILKNKIIHNILDEFILKQSEVIFIGDSLTDYTESKIAGIEIIGRIEEGSVNPFADVALKNSFEDFDQLDRMLSDQNLI